MDMKQVERREVECTVSGERYLFEIELKTWNHCPSLLSRKAHFNMLLLSITFLMQDPGGPVVKNPSCNAGDSGSIPGWGTKIPHAAEQLRVCATRDNRE